MSKRVAELTRTTKETDIICRLDLDGSGIADVETGIGFFDHMLTTLAKHSRFDLRLSCKAALSMDAIHSVKDCAIIIGNCLDDALGERQGIARFACAHVPLDEALCRAVVDLSGRQAATLINEHHRPGRYRTIANFAHLPSGIYQLQLVSGEKTISRKVVLLK